MSIILFKSIPYQKGGGWGLILGVNIRVRGQKGDRNKYFLKYGVDISTYFFEIEQQGRLKFNLRL